ncbi:transcription factor E2F/dimerization partner [Teladorsagia circumcincta]|uniref:Transcription factor E2F/dimerization partner n=1 Tax=Teladorsagia circumcincta TaxID=45464 RepID=A0A2G9UUY9_TELCI|nr:transcription factor E2F/dimerization partner [Teladorsagia circumcincta]
MRKVAAHMCLRVLYDSLYIPCRQSIHNSPRSFAMTTSASSRRQSCEDIDVESEDGEVTSRKEKSLGLLCQRFLVAMNEETRVSSSREVHLETVARKMSVEKRRIYDIVNVMEALDAMSKTNKSYYRWHGLEGLPKLMADLQKEAVEEHLPERVLRVEQAMCSFTELSPGSRKIGVKEIVGSLVGEDASPCSSTQSIDVLNLSQPSEKRNRVDGRDRQGRNSLAQLCRRFLMVLLSNPKNTRRVSLDVASTVLIKDPETEGFEPPSRSRCRRLYDIANVLVALGLIKKVHYLFGTKKIPLFVYCGPEPDGYHRGYAAFTVYGSEDFMSQASSSLMMFAELAAERLRQETELQQRPTSGPGTKRSFGNYSMSPLSSPLTGAKRYTVKIGNNYQMSTVPMAGLQPIVLPTTVPITKPQIKHTVTNILGTSNKMNVDPLNHRNSSPFQVVKKDNTLP